MSTPHPIKSRPSISSTDGSLDGDAMTNSSRAALLQRIKKCRSVPNLSVTQPNKKRKTVFHGKATPISKKGQYITTECLFISYLKM